MSLFPISFSQYQLLAHSTAIFPEERAIEYTALGLASEAGEVAGKVKKQIRDGSKWSGEQREDMRQHIASELGDVLWYVAEMCTAYGFDMDEVARMNLQKLQDRNARGVISGDGDKR